MSEAPTQLATIVNRWTIPDWLEREVLQRDRCCIYCGIDFAAVVSARRYKPSWEHIVNDARIVTRENIARCCLSCNASKGTKDLATWLHSRYCRTRGISTESVAAVVRAALDQVVDSSANGA
jgi:5-methylcytosine-specific restriction endonuclease McrA